MVRGIGIVASAKQNVASGPSAVRLSGQYYSRTATGLGGSIDYTAACWLKFATGSTSGFSTLIGMDNAGSKYNNIAQDNTANRFLGRICDAGDFFGPGMPAVTVNAWQYIALQSLAGATQDHFFYGTTTTLTDQIDGAGSGTLDTCTFYIGGDGFGLGCNGSIGCVRIWTAALTKTELEAEMVKLNPVRTANLWAAYSFRSGPQTNDESVNGRTLVLTTVGGSIATDTAGPPVT